MEVLPDLSPSLNPSTLKSLVNELAERGQLPPDLIEPAAVLFFRWLYQQILDHERVAFSSPGGKVIVSIADYPGKPQKGDSVLDN